jgi:predicted peroxiredoxin
MARLVYMGSHGLEDPTRAGLVFVAANGAKEAGHDPVIAIVGDGVLLMNETIAKNTVPVGWPPVKELMATSISHNIPIHV